MNPRVRRLLVALACVVAGYFALAALALSGLTGAIGIYALPLATVVFLCVFCWLVISLVIALTDKLARSGMVSFQAKPFSLPPCNARR